MKTKHNTPFLKCKKEKEKKKTFRVNCKKPSLKYDGGSN